MSRWSDGLARIWPYIRRLRVNETALFAPVETLDSFSDPICLLLPKKCNHASIGYLIALQNAII
jgi:hypothetical protein